MNVAWNTFSKSRWDRIITDVSGALAQDWAYGDAMGAIGAEVLRADVRDGDRMLALAQFTRRRFLGAFDVVLCTRGPVWLDVSGNEEKADVYRALRASLRSGRPRWMLFTPDGDDSASLRQARLNQVMTGYTTAVLDLDRDLDELRAGMQGKWRNRLRVAEEQGMRVRANGAKPATYDWLLKAEHAQRKRRGYRALPTKFVDAYRAAGKRGDALRLFRVERHGDQDAAMLFLRHGRTATYHIGWTSQEGRAANAHNLLLWRAIEGFKAEGVRRIDLGGVDTDRSPGLARFKLGVGAQPEVRCGTYG